MLTCEKKFIKIEKKGKLFINFEKYDTLLHHSTKQLI